MVIIDDHRVFTELFAEALQGAGWLVPATAFNLADGMAAVERFHPDLVVLDRNLPDGDGLTVLEHIRQVTPETRVLMLTASTDRDVLREALAAGCHGYVTKSRGISEVLAAVDAMNRGNTPISTDLGPSVGPGAYEPAPSFTARETDVLELVCAGMTNREVAERLYLSVNTVRNHVAHILDKLGARSKLEAMAIVGRSGLVGTRPERR
ncbi:response regulator transcription factor [Rhodococcus sp. 1168]|uniref:response regulator n=1 Tax=Rhodococcus sp. 1168 TaxID=2018041 RepID=UPI000A0A7EEF|nr:response regulator transcription factor [Rhodococcus sp. 1168]ORI25482.1 hypothetical protein BJI47_02165 [Rhodococcus sp. 1168]